MAGSPLSTEPKVPRPIAGLGEIVDDYDIFLVDQWGVLHDGINRYPGAREALVELTARGKHVVIITNSSKTSAVNERRLHERFGIERSLYHSLISSAELLRASLAAQAAEGRYRVFCVADAGDEVLLHGTGCTQVDQPGKADCVALLSVAPGEGYAEHRTWAKQALAAGLPVLSPSADALSVSTRGVVAGLARIIAAYREGGGVCLNFGKPEDAVYAAALAGVRTAPERVLTIGDQLESDVGGASRRGFASLLVLTGAGAIRVGADNPEAACRLLGSSEIPDTLLPTLVSASMTF